MGGSTNGAEGNGAGEPAKPASPGRTTPPRPASGRVTPPGGNARKKKRK